MYLTRHQTEQGPCWALDGRYLPQQFSLDLLLELPASQMANLLPTIVTPVLLQNDPLMNFIKIWRVYLFYFSIGPFS